MTAIPPFTTFSNYISLYKRSIIGYKCTKNKDNYEVFPNKIRIKYKKRNQTEIKQEYPQGKPVALGVCVMVDESGNEGCVRLAAASCSGVEDKERKGMGGMWE